MLKEHWIYSWTIKQLKKQGLNQSCFAVRVSSWHIAHWLPYLWHESKDGLEIRMAAAEVTVQPYNISTWRMEPGSLLVDFLTLLGCYIQLPHMYCIIGVSKASSTLGIALCVCSYMHSIMSSFPTSFLVYHVHLLVATKINNYNIKFNFCKIKLIVTCKCTNE